MREYGLQQRSYNRLYTRKPVCVSHQSFQSIGIDDCYTALLVIPGGMLLSISLFILEKIYRYKQFNQSLCVKL